jgi:uncharacterized protein YcbK (DUF882 family)
MISNGADNRAVNNRMAASSVARLVSALALATVALGLGTARAAPAPVHAHTRTSRAPKNPAVTLYDVNHRQTMALRLRDAQGRPVKGLQKRFDTFLRCHYTNQKHAMSPRLMRLMYQAGRHWPGHRLEVVSGYRHPDVAKNPHSPHMKGLACDFRVAGVKNTELRDYLRRSFDKVGVGYYPNSSFVHLDVRKDRSAFWIDYSGPGDRAMYSESPNEDLKTGRADTFHPTKIDSDWANEGAPAPIEAAPSAEAPSAVGAGSGGGLNP